MADLTAVPATITQGDSYALLLTEGDYPAPGWSLTLAVAGLSVDSWTSVAEGASHRITVPAADTALLDAGTYRWSLRATSGSTVTTFTSGALVVEASLVTAAPGELQSWAERTLAVVEAVLNNTATAEMKMYMINGRQVMVHSLDELMRLRATLRAEVSAQQTRTFGTPVRFDVVGMR